MEKEGTLSALISAVGKGRGYTFSARSVKNVNGIVYIGVYNPIRTITVTKRVYDKVKDYIVVEKRMEERHGADI